MRATPLFAAPPESYRYTCNPGCTDFERHLFDQSGVELDQNGGTLGHFWVNPPLINSADNKPLQKDDELQGITPIGLQAADPKRIVIGGATGVWESLDLGNSVSLIPGDPSSPRHAARLAYGHPRNPEALWVAAPSSSNTSSGGSDNPGIYARFAKGAPLKKLTAFPDNTARAVAMSAADAKVAYVTSDHNVYKTPDGGQTWTNVTGNLAMLDAGVLLLRPPGDLGSIVYIPSPATGDRVVVAAAQEGVPGVFMMAVNNPGVWTRVGTNLPNALPFELDYDAVRDLLVVGTVGRGAWTVGGVRTIDTSPAPACNSGPDATAPVFTFVPPDFTSSTCGSLAIGTALATDNCGTVTVTNNAPSRFFAGTTLVTWTARDSAGNTITATQRVTTVLGDDRSCCPPGTNVIVGTSNNDPLNGTSGADCILGLGGQDTINGNGGNDIISGGDGDDIINAGSGNDAVFGGTGQDQINGGIGDDSLYGADSDDTIHGDAGNDIIHGGNGQDHLFGDDGNDTLFGDDGDDTLTGGNGNDTLAGGGLHDTCTDTAGTNFVTTCQSSASDSCTNGVTDGTETGVDCGGACIKKCSSGACTSGADCQSGNCSAGSCVTQLITEFTIPTSASAPAGVTSAPDGAVWFAELTKIGRITSSGIFKEFVIPTSSSGAQGIVTGSDNNLWFCENLTNKIGRVTPNGAFTEFAVPGGNVRPGFIANGPDGALWFTERLGNKIGRVTTSGSFTQFSVPTAGALPTEIVVGGDSALWFDEFGANRIGRVTTSGSFTEFAVPGQPTSIAAGPDGNIWYTRDNSTVGRITSAGAVSEITLPIGAGDITAGSDGNLWFTSSYSTGGKIVRMTPQGAVTVFDIPSGGFAAEIATGPDGNLWFTEAGGTIGRIVPPRQ